MLWIFSQHFSYLWNAHVGWQPVLHTAPCVVLLGGERWLGVGGLKREGCSSEAQPHLLFMTHRKSFSLSSRWYPVRKHNDTAIGTQVHLTSPWKWNGTWISRSYDSGFNACFGFLLILKWHFSSFVCSCFPYFGTFLTLLFRLPVFQLHQGSPKFPQTRSECQGVWHHLCARPLATPSQSSIGTRRARRSTPSVSRWLSQCTMLSSHIFTSMNK